MCYNLVFQEEFYMKFNQLLKKTRSYRRFFEEEQIPLQTLKDIVANTRLAPSPANLQPLQYVIVTDKGINRELFTCLSWAAYIKEWSGPEAGERPAAYIVILKKKKKSTFIEWDYGIVLQTLLLSAAEIGYGGCAIAAFNKDKVRKILDIPENLELAAVIALGKPRERVVIDEVKGNDIRYWRDKDQIHHVPKRSIDELIYKILA